MTSTADQPGHTVSRALIGWSGFVGSTLLRQASFERRYRSDDVHRVGEQWHDLVVCAAAPAKKWLANREPEADRAHIERLIENLRATRCERFVLVSTVDVFVEPIGVDESSPVTESGLHAYGLHRRGLERFVQSHFERHLIVRLPGLVGPGLRKNALYDLQRDNDTQLLDGRSQFQFYPMVRLWHDISIALAAGLRLLHLTAQPVTLSEVARTCFARELPQGVGPAARYDLQTLHAEAFGATGRYQYSRRESLLAISAYAQSEPRGPATVAGA